MYAALKILVAAQALLFIVLAVSHMGLPVPLLGEVRAVALAIIEGLCGLGFLYASLHGGARTAFGAEAAAFAGLLLGLWLLTLDQAPRTAVTDMTYVLLLAFTGVGLLLSDRLARSPGS